MKILKEGIVVQSDRNSQLERKKGGQAELARKLEANVLVTNFYALVVLTLPFNVVVRRSVATCSDHTYCGCYVHSSASYSQQAIGRKHVQTQHIGNLSQLNHFTRLYYSKYV